MKNTLELLEFDFIKMPSEGVKFIEHMTHLTVLRIRGIDTTKTPRILRLLANLIHLNRIGLWTSDGCIDDADFIVFEKMLMLNEIILSTCISTKTSRAFHSLQKLQLKHLGLFYADLNDDYISILSKIRSLTTFHIGGCWNLTNTTVDSFKSLPALINISLSRISTIHLKQLNNPNLLTLRLSSVITFKYDGFDPKTLIHLTRLDLDNIRDINNYILELVSKITPLKELFLMGLELIKTPQYVGNTVKKEGLMTLVDLINLQTLVIKRCKNITTHDIKLVKRFHPNADLSVDTDFGLITI